MAWIKFYPISMRFIPRSAFSRRERVLFSYRGNGYDFEATIMKRADRMGYSCYNPEHSFRRYGWKSLVFER